MFEHGGSVDPSPQDRWEIMEEDAGEGGGATGADKDEEDGGGMEINILTAAATLTVPAVSQFPTAKVRGQIKMRRGGGAWFGCSQTES